MTIDDCVEQWVGTTARKNVEGKRNTQDGKNESTIK